MTTTKPLLELVDTVILPATATPFVAFDVVKANDANAARNSPLQKHIDHNFISFFLNKVEEPHRGSSLNCWRLTRPSHDGPIIEELGGGIKAEVTLAEFFALVAAQSRGERGPLLTNEKPNLFYIRTAPGRLADVAGESDAGLRLVILDWNPFSDFGNWRIYASAVGAYQWQVDAQVFSRR